MIIIQSQTGDLYYFPDLVKKKTRRFNVNILLQIFRTGTRFINLYYSSSKPSVSESDSESEDPGKKTKFFLSVRFGAL